ncbi:unnamed protein product [Moneuplotes crassus]|uniref:Uncharacterized protein n=1 Tax=Euplotes crassus TaxID=5936 RepID=A0AAD1U4K6_EUPCR|nr:unnamed protein product [Moneuplotes crassus]
MALSNINEELPKKKKKKKLTFNKNCLNIATPKQSPGSSSDNFFQLVSSTKTSAFKRNFEGNKSVKNTKIKFKNVRLTKMDYDAFNYTKKNNDRTTSQFNFHDEVRKLNANTKLNHSLIPKAKSRLGARKTTLLLGVNNGKDFIRYYPAQDNSDYLHLRNSLRPKLTFSSLAPMNPSISYSQTPTEFGKKGIKESNKVSRTPNTSSAMLKIKSQIKMRDAKIEEVKRKCIIEQVKTKLSVKNMKIKSSPNRSLNTKKKLRINSERGKTQY